MLTVATGVWPVAVEVMAVNGCDGGVSGEVTTEIALDKGCVEIISGIKLLWMTEAMNALEPNNAGCWPSL